MTVPAVVLVLAACLGGLRIGTEQVRLASAAGLAARSAARLDGDGRAAALGRRAGADAVAIADDGDLACANATASVPLLGVAVPLASRSCALLPAIR